MVYYSEEYFFPRLGLDPILQVGIIQLTAGVIAASANSVIGDWIDWKEREIVPHTKSN